MSIPIKLQAIVDDFAAMSREERLETLIAYAESLPPLPDWLLDDRAKMDAVPECMTPVELFGEKKEGYLLSISMSPLNPLLCVGWPPSLPTD